MIGELVLTGDTLNEILDRTLLPGTHGAICLVCRRWRSIAVSFIPRTFMHDGLAKFLESNIFCYKIGKMKILRSYCSNGIELQLLINDSIIEWILSSDKSSEIRYFEHNMNCDHKFIELWFKIIRDFFPALMKFINIDIDSALYCECDECFDRHPISLINVTPQVLSMKYLPCSKSCEVTLKSRNLWLKSYNVDINFNDNYLFKFVSHPGLSNIIRISGNLPRALREASADLST